MALRKIRMPEVLDIKQRATQLEQTSYQLSSCLWLDLGKKSLSWAKWQALLFLSIFCPLASGTLRFHCCVTRSCFVFSQSRNLDCFVHSLPCGILKRALEIAGCHRDLNTHHQANCWRQRQDLCPRAVELMFACCDSWAWIHAPRAASWHGREDFGMAFVILWARWQSQPSSSGVYRKHH